MISEVVSQPLHWPSQFPGDHIAQSGITLRRFVPDTVFLAEVFDGDNGVRHIPRAEIKTLGHSSGDWPPRMAQRKPSITPTIGFREYRSCHRSGTILLLKPTGEM